MAEQTVTINENVSGAIYGNGEGVNGTNPGGSSALLDPHNNTVIINSGTVSSDVSGADDYNDNGSATGNRVTINDGTLMMGAYGAYTYATNGSSTASGNSVTINGGTVERGVYGGQSNTDSGSATASNNSVIVSGGTVKGPIAGGFASASAGSEAASNNTVTISGGSIMGGVVGGLVWHGSSSATNNTVTISGNPTMSGGLRGGDSTTGSGGDLFAGNRLNLHSSGLTVAYMNGFQTLNFYLPTTLNAGDTMLTVIGEANLTDGGSWRSTVNVGIDGASTPLKAGDQVILIDAGTLTGTSANNTADGSGMQGVTLNYEFDLTTSNNQLLATVKGQPGQPGQPGGTLNEQTKSLSEGYLASLALVNQGSELIDWHGMQDAASGKGVFGKIAGGSLKYDTGSNIEMSSVSLMSGFAWNVNRLTFGAFFEYGNGDYDTHNAFRTSASIDGSGDADYMGLGFAARFKATDNAYLDAALRAGKVKNDYNDTDLVDNLGRKATFDTSATYTSLQLGGGTLLKLTEKGSADFYGRMYWTHQGGDTVRLGTGEQVEFDDLNSTRLRLGGRYNHTMSKATKLYAGLAWEHEFDGKARATTNGYAIDAPELQGSSGIGEAGVIIKAGRNLNVDLGLQGYAGKRRGVTGSANVRYAF